MNAENSVSRITPTTNSHTNVQMQWSALREQQRELTAMYKVVLPTLEKHDVTYWLDWDTLLGVYRDGSLMLGESSLDAGILKEDIAKVLGPVKKVWSQHQQVLARAASILRHVRDSYVLVEDGYCVTNKESTNKRGCLLSTS